MDDHKVCLPTDLTADCTFLRTAAPDSQTDLPCLGVKKKKIADPV